MRKKIDDKTKIFLRIFDKIGVKFVDCETDEDLLDDSEDDSAK